MSPKLQDLSSPWSDQWILDEHTRRYYKSRYNPAGELEYWYNEEPNPQPNNVPRNANLTPYIPQSQSSTYDTQAEYTTSSMHAAPQATSPYGQASFAPQYSLQHNTASEFHSGSSQGWPSAPNQGWTTPLSSDYRVETDRNFWVVGRVFKTPWTEPARPNPKNVLSSHGSGYSETPYGGKAYTEIRRFVIIQNNHGNAWCSPIHSYGGQATLKSNLAQPQEHAIIYTSEEPPNELYRQEGDRIVYENLTKDPIKVNRVSQNPGCDLGDKSRLNYVKIYTVEKSQLVFNIGMVENVQSLLAGAHRSTEVNKSRSGGGGDSRKHHKSKGGHHKH